MKIVHVLLGAADPNTMNGVNKVVHHLATHQHRAGHELEVWSLRSIGRGDPAHDHEYRLRTFRTTTARFLLAPDLADRLRALPMNIWVQLHSVFIPEYWAMTGILRKRGIAFGITPHGGYSRAIFATRRAKKLTYLRLIESTVLRRARLFHAVAASELADIRRLVPDAPIVLVPNGQEPLTAPHMDRRICSCPRPIFCYCGRLAMHHKGLDLLLMGFERYLRGGGQGSLWFIGDGADRPRLEAMTVRLGIEKAVFFHGRQLGDAKLELLSMADVFVHASRWDGTPTAVLEAAALGLPLLLSRETNVADLVEANHAGLVLSQNAPEEIARQLTRMEASFGTGDTLRMGRNARAMIETFFSWPEIASSLALDFHRALTEPVRA